MDVSDNAENLGNAESRTVSFSLGGSQNCLGDEVFLTIQWVLSCKPMIYLFFNILTASFTLKKS